MLLKIPTHLGLPRELLASEYVQETIGIHTRWTVSVGRLQSPSHRSRVLKLLECHAPDPKEWHKEAKKLVCRLPLLVRFTIDLARENGWHFWALVLGKAVQSVVPAAELMCYTAILDIARAIPETGRFDGTVLAIAFLCRTSLLLISLAIDQYLEHTERVINSRFTTTVQTLILRIHCSLPDEALSSPEVQNQLSTLRGLDGSSAYGQVFDPVGFLRVLNVGLGMGLEIGILTLRVNGANRWLLGLCMAFIALQAFDPSTSSPIVEHVDTTHDGYLRLQNLFKLGTSPAFRREVNSLNLQDFLLKESSALRQSLGNAETTPVSTSPFSHPRRQLRFHAGGSLSTRSFSLRSVLLDLEKSITYALFILVSASQARSRRGGPLMVFGDVAILENATRNLHFRALELRRYVTELQGGLENMHAFYEGAALEARFQRKLGGVYTTQVRELENGRVARGMKVEFRNVTLRYPGGGPPALEDVSFVVLPGEVVAICGFNGSGKTSIISLLAMTESNYTGTIEVNDVDIRSYDRRTLYRRMSFAFQSSPALPFTIREYVALGSVDDPHDDQLVRDALCASGADQVVDRLPNGWNTYPSSPTGMENSYSDPWAALEASWDLPRVSKAPLPPPTLRGGPGDDPESAFSWWEDTTTKVGSGRTSPDEKDPEASTASILTSKDATRDYAVQVDGQPMRLTFPLHSPTPRVLSGGQWQRIALARALFKANTDLLVLDEPGGPLDPAAEASLFDKVLHKRGETTVMFSTHRFGATARADKILLFDAGRLIECGSHTELMDFEKGQYRSLWEVQAKGFEA